MAESLPTLWLTRWHLRMNLGQHWYDAQHAQRTLYQWAVTTGYFLDAEKIKARAINAQAKSAEAYALAREIREKYLD